MSAENHTHIQDTYKSKDTEEWFDTVFNRPVGFAWAKFFNYFGIHPNVVTVLSMILGALSGFMFHYHATSESALWGMSGMTCNIIAVILLVWANHYDSADGQLARLSGKKTQLGRILDGVAADVWYISIYVALAYRMYDDPVPFTGGTVNFRWWGLVLCVLSGVVGHIYPCRLADYYRNIHLFFLKGESGSEFDHFAQLEQTYNNMPWKGNVVNKTFLWFYKSYTWNQEKETPAFQAYWTKVRETYGDDIPQKVRDDFREKSLPLMKYTNFLTFNARGIALYVAALINQPWIYLAFEIIVLGLVYKYMGYRHEKMCKELIKTIE